MKTRTNRYVMKGTLVFDTKRNKKMYPVGNFMNHQHMIFNYSDKCYNEMMETETSDSYDRFYESEQLVDKFNTNPRINGIVYAYYEDYKKLKDIIGGYIVRRDTYRSVL